MCHYVCAVTIYFFRIAATGVCVYTRFLRTEFDDNMKLASPFQGNLQTIRSVIRLYSAKYHLRLLYCMYLQQFSSPRLAIEIYMTRQILYTHKVIDT